MAGADTTTGLDFPRWELLCPSSANPVPDKVLSSPEPSPLRVRLTLGLSTGKIRAVPVDGVGGLLTSSYCTGRTAWLGPARLGYSLPTWAALWL